MDVRPYTLRTEVFINLGQPFGGTGLIFKAYVEAIDDHHRLTIFEDIRGVLDCVTRARLITPPDSFPTEEAGYDYWREILRQVEVEWDHAELTAGNRVRLFFPNENGQLVPLGEWETPGRFDVVIQRRWADIPAD